MDRFYKHLHLSSEVYSIFTVTHTAIYEVKRSGKNNYGFLLDK